jgi:hypothetical protein
MGKAEQDADRIFRQQYGIDRNAILLVTQGQHQRRLVGTAKQPPIR